MDETLKKKIIDAVKAQVPECDENRLSTLLNLILIEIDASNSCASMIDWSKLSDVISEILYQTAKNELDEGVASVKRGDTSISYRSSASVTQSLIAGYHDLINRILGCSDGLEFF